MSQFGDQGVHLTCSAWALAGTICAAAEKSYNISLSLEAVKATLLAIPNFDCWRQGATLLEPVEAWNNYMKDETKYIENTQGRYRFIIEYEKFACFADT